jgi:hypothetical protein
MSKKTSKQLKTLSELPKEEYIAMIKELNPDLTETDLQDMFPEGQQKNHVSFNESHYDDYRKHQLAIDAQLEDQFCGGYELDEDFDY